MKYFILYDNIRIFICSISYVDTIVRLSIIPTNLYTVYLFLYVQCFVCMLNKCTCTI